MIHEWVCDYVKCMFKWKCWFTSQIFRSRIQIIQNQSSVTKYQSSKLVQILAKMLTRILSPQINRAQLLSCSRVAKRWRSHHPRTHRPPGRHPLDIKIAHPVKDRSEAKVLPINKKIFFVTNGWWYDRSTKLQELQKPAKNFTPCLAFVRNEKHRLLHVFTASEMAEIEKYIFQII